MLWLHGQFYEISCWHIRMKRVFKAFETLFVTDLERIVKRKIVLCSDNLRWNMEVRTMLFLVNNINSFLFIAF